jgi:hypothetical protein
MASPVFAPKGEKTGPGITNGPTSVRSLSSLAWHREPIPPPSGVEILY